MIPFFIALGTGRNGGGTFPKMSYVFLVPALAGLGCAIYFASQFWVGYSCAQSEYEETCNIMYHDPVNFLFAAMLLCLSTICVLKFIMYHGPFAAGQKGERK
jgi:hypothetical protein